MRVTLNQTKDKGFLLKNDLPRLEWGIDSTRQREYHDITTDDPYVAEGGMYAKLRRLSMTVNHAIGPGWHAWENV